MRWKGQRCNGIFTSLSTSGVLDLLVTQMARVQARVDARDFLGCGGLAEGAEVEGGKAIAGADSAGALWCFLLLLSFAKAGAWLGSVWSGLVARGGLVRGTGAPRRACAAVWRAKGRRQARRRARRGSMGRRATGDGEGQTAIISHTARWQIGGPQANPCHRQLNNSSCISASQGMRVERWRLARRVLSAAHPCLSKGRRRSDELAGRRRWA